MLARQCAGDKTGLQEVAKAIYADQNFSGLGALATALSQPRASWDKEARLIYFDLDTAALCIAALFANHLNTEALNIIAHVSDDFAHQRA